MVRNRHGRLPIDEDQTQKVTRAGPGPRPAVLAATSAGSGRAVIGRLRQSTVPVEGHRG